MAYRRIPKLNSVNTTVIVDLLRFLISDLCSPDVSKGVVLQYFTRTMSLFTVVTVVVTGSTLCFFTVSWSLSLFVLARCLPASSFPVKAGPRRPALRTLSVQNNHHGCMTHRPLGISHVLVFLAVARRTCDVSRKRLEHPPLASVRVILTDGSRTPPSACVASLVHITPDIQPHRSVALLLLKKKTTLVLRPMSLFLTLTSLPWHSSVACAALSLHDVDAGLTLRRQTLSSSSAPFR